MHKEAVIPELLEVLRKLMTLELLNPLRLVGGTAISLQIGHRKSIDIDLFCNEKGLGRQLIKLFLKRLDKYFRMHSPK